MASIAQRVQKHRDELRKAGLRPVQIWVPDSRNPNFKAECLRQSRLAAKGKNASMDSLMESVLTDFIDSGEWE